MKPVRKSQWISPPDIDMGGGPAGRFVRGPRAQFARAQAQKERQAKYQKYKVEKTKT